MISGIYLAKKKNGETYYRSSITYKNKHISLGSYNNEADAKQAYMEACYLIGRLNSNTNTFSLDKIISKTKPINYSNSYKLPLDKYISIINYRDNGIYFSKPIYIYNNYFEYYMSNGKILKFDRDDLFFYSSHKIQTKGGYLFVCDYGSQYSILNRYGIKQFAVYDRDYLMINGDENDFRYSNIKIINHYFGVEQREKDGTIKYYSYININGRYLIGKYNSDIEGAIAYNKSIDILKEKGLDKNFIKNYILTLSSSDYKKIYKTINISSSIMSYIHTNPNS